MKLIRWIPLLAAILGGGLPLRAALADGIKAIVDNSVITYREVEEYAAPAIDQLRQQYANQPDVYSQKLNQALNEGLEQLVDRQLILHDFQTKYAKLPESVVDDLVAERIRQRFGDRSTLMKTLQARGETYEQFRKEVRDQYIVSALRSKNIAQEIVISPYKVETYYRQHQADFKVGDQVKLRMIVINKSNPDDRQARQMAEEIRSQIQNGASFAQMASVYSQGSQRSQGGDWGWIDHTVLRPKLSKVAFSLKPNQVSQVIELPGACYLMQVEQTRPAHVKPLEQVRDDIEATLRTQEQSRLEKQWIDRLKQKTFIRYF